MKYRVTHRTRYSYDESVHASYGLAYLIPRETENQRVRAVRIDAEPEPIDAATHTDHFGNAAWYFQIGAAHRRLDVLSACEVEVEVPDAGPGLALPWEEARPAVSTDPDAWRLGEFAAASPLVAVDGAVAAYGAGSLTAGRPLGEGVMEIVHRIAVDFEYRPGSTTITSTVADVMAARAGVCQDFAHLMIAVLRAQGLAARYVSGYLATDAPAGRSRVRGADATHAWLAVWIPGGGWFPVDPTNDQAVDDRYVTVAWGRDYSDVAPLKGVIVSDAASSELTVEVDVEPVR